MEAPPPVRRGPLCIEGGVRGGGEPGGGVPPAHPALPGPGRGGAPGGGLLCPGGAALPGAQLPARPDPGAVAGEGGGLHRGTVRVHRTKGVRPAGAAPRPGAPGDPPGHQAGEHRAGGGWGRGPHRFRHRPAVQAGAGERHPPHGQPLHRPAGAVRLRSDRRPGRSLRPGGHPELAAHRLLRAGRPGGGPRLPAAQAGADQGRRLLPRRPLPHRRRPGPGPPGAGAPEGPADCPGRGGLYRPLPGGGGPGPVRAAG